jgi:hypothetical protein
MHQVVARHPGYTTGLIDVLVLAGESQTAHLELKSPQASRPVYRRGWLWGTVAAAAAAGAGVALAVSFGRPQDPHASLGTASPPAPFGLVSQK